MKISDYIKQSIDDAGRNNLESALLHACAAVDGTAKKKYGIDKVGQRFRQFITDHIDIIQHMFGGIDLQNTVFPFVNKKGQKGVKFEDVLYENYRCKLAHGDDLGDGWGVDASIIMHLDQFHIDLVKKSMTLPQSVIYSLNMSCVLSEVNADQRIGDKEYFLKDLHHMFYIDHWWGKLSLARDIIYFDRDVVVKLDFQNHMK